MNMSDWQPIETVPKQRNVLLFAFTESGSNYKMETGYWMENEFVSSWNWPYALKEYDVKPTHWMPMPPPPEAS